MPICSISVICVLLFRPRITCGVTALEAVGCLSVFYLLAMIIISEK